MRFARVLFAVAALAAVSGQTISQTASVANSNINTSTSPPSLATITAANAAAESSPIPSASTSSTESSSSSTTSSSSASLSPTVLPPDFFNSTGDANLNASAQRPPLTPAIIIAGLIFMVTGGAYTIIGVKNRYQQIFLSTAYLTSLAVVVLIVYVVNPPISNAIQGAYLVAVVVTGLIFGALAVIFVEVTEGFGALLGGFCISMWILSLVPGGLIQNKAAKSIFISAMSLAMFGTTFSHHTRQYGLIVGTAFSGATFFVLGLDCFSRAGLKEFWLYIWNLNDKMFPLKSNTFSITRGMRVELAAQILVFALGIISQIKLWRIIYKKRQQRAAARRDEEEKVEAAERKAERRHERQAARDREQWEETYGKEDEGHEKADSGIGSSSTDGDFSKEQSIEMSDLSIRDAEQGTPKESHLSPSTSRVGSGIISPASVKRLSATSMAEKQEPPASPPVLVPLPHNPPPVEDDGDDASSLATAATDEHGSVRNSRRNSKRDSIGSQSSWRKRFSKRSSRQPEADETPILVPHIEEDQASSIAATLDDMTDRDEVQTTYSPLASPVAASFREVPDITNPNETIRVVPIDDQMVTSDSTDVIPEKRHSIAGILAEEAQKLVPKRLSLDAAQKEQSRPPAVEPVSSDKAAARSPPREDVEPEDDVKPGAITRTVSKPTPLTTAALRSRSRSRSRTGKSTKSVTESVHSFSEQLANARVSKVVMSYRTNEWAKHLEDADAPNLEAEKFEYPPDQRLVEKAVPVDVEVLQQTATTARPPTTVRSPSAASNYVDAQPAIPPTAVTQVPGGYLRSASAASFYPAQIPTSQSQPLGIKMPLETIRSTSAASFYESPIEMAPPSRPYQVRKSASAMALNFTPEDGVAIPGPAMPLRGHRRPESREIRARTPSMDMNHCTMSPPALYNGVAFTGSASQLPPQYGGVVRESVGTLGRTQSTSKSTPNLLSGRTSSASLRRHDSINEAANPQFAGFYEQQATISQLALKMQAQQALYAQQQQVVANSNGRMSAQGDREAKLANFRESLAFDLAKSKLSTDHVDSRRVELLAERERRLEVARMNQNSRQQRDSVIDEMMRRDDMIDLHREAMRRMQSQVGKGGNQ